MPLKLNEVTSVVRHHRSIATRDTRLVDTGLKLFLAQQIDNHGYGENSRDDQSGNKEDN